LRTGRRAGRSGSSACSDFLSGKELAVRTQVASRHSAFDRLSRGETVAEKGRAAISLHLWLILHVLPAGADENDKQKKQQKWGFSLRREAIAFLSLLRATSD
jgi:hypothetical protein